MLIERGNVSNIASTRVESLPDSKKLDATATQSRLPERMASMDSVNNKKVGDLVSSTQGGSKIETDRKALDPSIKTFVLNIDDCPSEQSQAENLAKKDGRMLITEAQLKDLPPGAKLMVVGHSNSEHFGKQGLDAVGLAEFLHGLGFKGAKKIVLVGCYSANLMHNFFQHINDLTGGKVDFTHGQKGMVKVDEGGRKIRVDENEHVVRNSEKVRLSRQQDGSVAEETIRNGKEVESLGKWDGSTQGWLPMPAHDLGGNPTSAEIIAFVTGHVQAPLEAIIDHWPPILERVENTDLSAADLTRIEQVVATAEAANNNGLGQTSSRRLDGTLELTQRIRNLIERVEDLNVNALRGSLPPLNRLTAVLNVMENTPAINPPGGHIVTQDMALVHAEAQIPESPNNAGRLATAMRNHPYGGDTGSTVNVDGVDVPVYHSSDGQGGRGGDTAFWVVHPRTSDRIIVAMGRHSSNTVYSIHWERPGVDTLTTVGQGNNQHQRHRIDFDSRRNLGVL